MNPRIRRLGGFWRQFKRNKAAVLGLAVSLFFLMIALLGPLISPYDPYELVAERLQEPCFNHPMGTDDLGRDIFSQVLYGARISLLIGFSAAGISVVVGVLVGSISGFSGGKVDDILMRTTELFQTIPRFFLAILLISFFGSSVWNVILAIGILSWPSTARLVRAEFLSLRERQFVEAAKAVGAGNLNIVVDEILPNALSPVIVNGTLQLASAILLEAMLSFLGLGDPNVFSWGTILNNAQLYLRQAWWMVSFAGIMIAVTVLGLNLVGDGLNDALNPRLKE